MRVVGLGIMDAQSPSAETAQQHEQSMNDSTVLQSLSLERTNRQPMLPPPTPTTAPSSPALSVGSPHKAHLFQDPFLSSRRGSDVQGKVAQFNNLSRTNSERRQDLEKALQRARLGREQAESENESLRRKINEYVERERRVGLRIEQTMEENEKLRSDSQRLKEKYERAKDALAHSKDRFREELRRMKGAEFKADSNQLAAQQALQSERQLVKSLEMELKYSRDKSDRFEKESFTTQIKLVELDEQLARVQQQMQLVEEERNALRTSLKEEEVARIAAEGRIPLPICSTPDEFSSPRKRRESHIPTPKAKRSSRANLAEAIDFDLKKHNDDLASLTRRLEIETLSRKNAEDLIHFMKLECQLQRCSCRLAEHQGTEYVCDEHFFDVIADLKRQYQDLFPEKQHEMVETQAPPVSRKHVQQAPTLIDLEDEIEYSPETGTFRSVKSPQKPVMEVGLTPASNEEVSSPNDTVIKALAPAFEIQSPSEATETFRKISTDACQILPAVQVNHPEELLDDESPATPKVYQPRASDADLISFTPFVLPSLSSQSSASSTSSYTSHGTVNVAQRRPAPPVVPMQVEPSFHNRPVSQQGVYHQAAPQQEVYVRQTSQHASSYPQPHHKSSTHQEPSQMRSTSALSQRPQHSSNRSIDSRQGYTIQTITTTTTIPLALEPSTPSSKTLPQTISNSVSAPAGLGFSPGTTKSREEALACIRSWRRGNAEAAMASKDTNTKLNGGQSSGNGMGSSSGSSAGHSNAKPRSRSVVLPATPGRRKVAGDRDVSAPVRL